MEYEMKISPSAVRRMRLSRGWSQEQLATVSGVSLRTVQRVEAEGISSISTVVSLAATFGVQLTDLQEDAIAPATKKSIVEYSPLFLGIAVISLAGLAESGRVTSYSMSNVLAAMNIFGVTTGFLVAAPVFFRLILRKQFFGAILAVMGAPLVTLLAVGVIYSIVSGQAPNLNLVLVGASGAVFTALAFRDLWRSNAEARA